MVGFGYFVVLAEWLTMPLPFPVLALPLAVGAVCLGAGIALGIKANEPSLLLFVLPVSAPESLLWCTEVLARTPYEYASYALRGVMGLVLILVPLSIAVYLVHRFERARAAAMFLAVFVAVHTLFAAFMLT